MSDGRLSEIRARAPVMPSDDFDVERVGPERTGGAAIYLWKDVADRLISVALHREERYQVALLSGAFLHGPTGDYLEIRGFLDAEKVESPRAFVRSLAGDWDTTQNRLARRAPGLTVVGWASIRPGGGGELSRLERMAHRTFFNEPYQVVCCIDPAEQWWTIWGPDEMGRLRPQGFNLISRSRRVADEPSDPQTIASSSDDIAQNAEEDGS